MLLWICPGKVLEHDALEQLGTQLLGATTAVECYSSRLTCPKCPLFRLSREELWPGVHGFDAAGAATALKHDGYTCIVLASYNACCFCAGVLLEKRPWSAREPSCWTQCQRILLHDLHRKWLTYVSLL